MPIRYNCVVIGSVLSIFILSLQPHNPTTPRTRKPTNTKPWPGGMRARALNPPITFLRGT